VLMTAFSESTPPSRGAGFLVRIAFEVCDHHIGRVIDWAEDTTVPSTKNVIASDQLVSYYSSSGELVLFGPRDLVDDTSIWTDGRRY
jgi:hypothetical protein